MSRCLASSAADALLRAGFLAGGAPSGTIRQMRPRPQLQPLTLLRRSSGMSGRSSITSR